MPEDKNPNELQQPPKPPTEQPSNDDSSLKMDDTQAAQSEPEQEDQTTVEPEVEMHEIKSGGTNSYFIAIGAAVIFAVVLIAFGIMAFGEDNTQSATSSSKQQVESSNLPVNPNDDLPEEEDVTSPLTESVLDEEIQEIDSEIESLDDDDFDDSELSDESLGL